MHRHDLAIYGHLTKDTIFFSDFSKKFALGAIGNIWEALSREHPSLTLDIQPLALGEAIILVDTENGNRLGRGRLNAVTRSGTASSARWHHIMYLNQLEDVSFMKEIKEGVISVDITAGKVNNIDMLRYVDYLFISDEDMFMDLDQLSSLVRGWVVLHYPSGSTITNGEQTYKTKATTVKNLNVLGAGDCFAGCFIGNLLEDENMTLAECAKRAHKSTLKILKEVNGGNKK